MTSQSPRAYAYARVSDHGNDGTATSVTAQIAAIRAFAAKNGIALVHIFDEPSLNADQKFREQFNRMIAHATSTSRPVAMIIVYELSRFARHLLTHVVSQGKLSEAGVKLVSVIDAKPTDVPRANA